MSGIDYSRALAAGTYADSSKPTATEIQTVIDAYNAALAEVVEDIAGNQDGTPATAEQINAIAGVSGAIDGVDYSAALKDGTYTDSTKPTATEIQAVIDAKNTSDAAIAEVVEDIAGNENTTPAHLHRLMLLMA